MNKDQLKKLQEKVNRLMRNSSDDSDENNQAQFNFHLKETQRISQIDPDTIRKCMDVVEENKRLKIELQRERKQKQRISKELQALHRQRSQQQNSKKVVQLPQRPNNKNQKQQGRRIGKMQAEIQQRAKRNSQLERLLAAERKKCRQLCNFINQNIPSLEQSLDKMTNRIDAKLQKYFQQSNS